MGIRYENLDELTRQFMAQESALGGHYASPRLTRKGLAGWPGLLNAAIQNHDDDWLAAQLVNNGYLLDEENYTRNGRENTRAINKPHAALQLAEGEFNRYYLRGLCRRAQEAGIDHLIVYRGKNVNNPRPESEARIGTQVNVAELLDALRQNDFVSIEDALAVPSGPNSGLTARLP